MAFHTEPFPDLTEIRGVQFPEGTAFRQLLFVGPPGAGKTSLVGKLRGWPEEGYLDLASRWWRSPQLTFRPREVHLGFPIVGGGESMALFEPEWLADMAPIDLSRVLLPPERRWFFQSDWRRRLIFDIQLLPAETIYELRQSRAKRGSHLVDRAVTLSQVSRQVEAYTQLAEHFQRRGMQVHVRTSLGGPPLRVVPSERADEP